MRIKVRFCWEMVKLQSWARGLGGSHLGFEPRILDVFFWMFRAHMGQYGPGPGPYEGETFQENLIFCYKHFYRQSSLFIQMLRSFYSFNVFFGILHEKSCRTMVKLPQKASFGTNTCILKQNRTCIILP